MSGTSRTAQKHSGLHRIKVLDSDDNPIGAVLEWSNRTGINWHCIAPGKPVQNAFGRLQERLSELGYWLGPPNGIFGDSTQQAVWALQKAAGLSRDGVVGTRTVFALASGVVPKPRPASGNLIEVDLEDDLVMIIQGGKLAYTLNTSTGGGYTYTDKGVTSVAITPKGVFQILGAINGLDVDSLGTLWRPRFFTEGGIAIHGDTYVPPYPVSHGCVRVSNEAINWIWANNIAPFGEEVWVF